MKRHIGIFSAWPYGNGDLHLGHTCALLPADLLARYFRLNGDHVMWTSGTDSHGTPITERAEREGTTAAEVAARYHERFVEQFAWLGFSYDIYWRTTHPNHHTRVQATFAELDRLGLITEGDSVLAFCDTCDTKRVDREVLGECSICLDNGARGDQCDACGTQITPADLTNPRCSKCSGTVRIEKSRALFLDLPQLADRLSEWVTGQTHWRTHVRTMTLGWIESGTGLQARSISRDIEWGIPIPREGWKDHVFYVWFDAFQGYLNASMEWAEEQSDPDAWKPFWVADDPNVLHYYAIGQDNITFHTTMWPAILMALGLALPHHVAACAFLQFEDKKVSTRSGWAVWVPDVMERHDPDGIRYFLIRNGPESRDTNFTWQQYVERFNNELVGTWGNLVQRVLSLVQKKLGGQIPTISCDLDEADTEMQRHVVETFQAVAGFLEETRFRRAIETAMELAHKTNRYVADRAPWQELKTDPARGATTLRIAMDVIAALSVLFEPFMPFSSARLRETLGIDEITWQPPALTDGHKIGEVTHLFAKLDKGVVADELARLQAATTAEA